MDCEYICSVALIYRNMGVFISRIFSCFDIRRKGRVSLLVEYREERLCVVLIINVG